jgi:putative ABC transport system permease protein
MSTIEVAGPTTFYVMRYFSQTPLDPNNLPYEVRIRPVLGREDAAAIRAIPEIRYAGLWIQLFARLEHQGVRTQLMTVFAADDNYMEIQGGTLLRGRFFTRSELAGANVVVLEEAAADRLFGRIEPIGRIVRISGRPLRVIGIYQKPANIFEPPSQEIAGVIPYETGRTGFFYDETNALFICVKPNAGVGVARAQDLVTVALRRARQLRPGVPNTFDLISQDQILETVNGLTSIFFLVMVALSGVALLVGGIGVMAIMMVSVTDRTREIGLRKAVGATRREILWQFLVEAATLTSIGAGIGLFAGTFAAMLVSEMTPIPAQTPPGAIIAALGMSALTGMVFGLWPALKASRLDPVEALRFE